ncbi:hypothetical protein HN51_020220 [Arachis hypogaea]
MVVEEAKATVGSVVTVEFVVIVDMVMVDKVEDVMTVVHVQPWWAGSRKATREEADAKVGTAAFVAAEAATTMGIFWTFCNKLSNKPNKPSEKIKLAAAPNHSQEARSHLG